MIDKPRAFAAHQVQSGDRWTLMLQGELDLASAPLLEAKLHEAERSGVKHLELDLSDLAFIDSTGLAVLIRANQSAELNGHTFSLRGQNPQVQRLLELTGVLDRFIFHDGLPQPLSSRQA